MAGPIPFGWFGHPSSDTGVAMSYDLTVWYAPRLRSFESAMA